MQTSAAIILHGMMRLGEMIGCFPLEGARDLMNLNSKAWGELVWLRRWDATQWYNLINYTFLLLVLLKPMKARLYQVFLRDRNSSAGQGTHARGLVNEPESQFCNFEHHLTVSNTLGLAIASNLLLSSSPRHRASEKKLLLLNLSRPALSQPLHHFHIRNSGTAEAPASWTHVNPAKLYTCR